MGMELVRGKELVRGFHKASRELNKGSNLHSHGANRDRIRMVLRNDNGDSRYGEDTGCPESNLIVLSLSHVRS